jgi:hypothetical protein
VITTPEKPRSGYGWLNGNLLADHVVVQLDTGFVVLDWQVDSCEHVTMKQFRQQVASAVHTISGEMRQWTLRHLDGTPVDTAEDLSCDEGQTLYLILNWDDPSFVAEHVEVKLLSGAMILDMHIGPDKNMSLSLLARHIQDALPQPSPFGWELVKADSSIVEMDGDLVAEAGTTLELTVIMRGAPYVQVPEVEVWWVDMHGLPHHVGTVSSPPEEPLLVSDFFAQACDMGPARGMHHLETRDGEWISENRPLRESYVLLRTWDF